jgi:hypothetical protein
MLGPAAVNDRNATDNQGQPQASSVQLSRHVRANTPSQSESSIRSRTEEIRPYLREPMGASTGVKLVCLLRIFAALSFCALLSVSLL